MNDQDRIRRAVDILSKARHAVAFTGAGISTPSGIPDFQSQNTGLWQRFDPMQVASIGAFQTRPQAFYDWLRPLLRDSWNAQPNPAHSALAQLEARGILKALITQNIDDLHQRAGSRTVLEVHGSLRSVICPGCQHTYPSADFRDLLAQTEDLPRCPGCGRIVKPAITLYGEMLPADTWAAAEEHCLRADVVLVAGSSLSVFPAYSLPEIALQNGAQILINNRTPTHLDEYAAVLLPMDVAEALPQIAALLTT